MEPTLEETSPGHYRIPRGRDQQGAVLYSYTDRAALDRNEHKWPLMHDSFSVTYMTNSRAIDARTITADPDRGVEWTITRAADFTELAYLRLPDVDIDPDTVFRMLATIALRRGTITETEHSTWMREGVTRVFDYSFPEDELWEIDYAHTSNMAPEDDLSIMPRTA